MSFYGELAFLLYALWNADWMFFHLTLEKLNSPTWVFFVCLYVMQWYFSVTLWPGEGLNHIISDREIHFLIEVRSENGSLMVQPGFLPKQKEIAP